MKYVQLGKTGLNISRVGFGGIPIQRITPEEARTLMQAVTAAGINYIDTAKAYTVSESYIGQAIAGMRDKFVLATKSMARTKEAMAADIQDSLNRLQTDYIDLYQVHNPNMEQLRTVCAPGGALEALLEAKAAGKIRHIGLTAHSAAVFETGLSMDWVETIMFPYNIVETQGEALMHRCAEQNVGFIAMKPLAGGALEDAKLAMRFICANPDVTVVIPGMYSPAEVTENVAAAGDTTPLTDAEQEKLRTIRNELGSNFCRRCNYCAPCTVGISIPSVFLFEGYLSRYNLEGWARERYATLNVKAGACIGCGVCETRCPYHLPIRQMLKKSAEEFGE
jgi:predicted aldo/keto reductase-like oxidoreductase